MSGLQERNAGRTVKPETLLKKVLFAHLMLRVMTGSTVCRQASCQRC